MFSAACLLAVLLVVNQVLLFFYWGPSRFIYFLSYLLLIPATLLQGLNVFSPVEYFLYEVSTFLSGMTLALAYFSPVAERFSRRKAGQV